MRSIGALIVLVVLALGLLISVGVINAGLSNQGPQQTYSEDFTPGTGGSLVTLNQSNLDTVYYTDAVTVTDENGTEMRATEDYEWYSSNGTLRVLSGGRLVNDSTATVNYSYRAPTGQQRSLASQLAQFVNVAYALPLVLAAALVMIGASVLGNL
jgi:hypothetical protein